MNNDTENTEIEMSEEDAMAIELPPLIKVVPVVDTVEHELPSENSVLAYTHHVRKKLIAQMMKDGVCEDPKVVLQALDGMDRQALTRARLQVDKETAQGVGQANQAVLAGLIRALKSEAPPLLATARTAPQLPSHILPPSLVEGETDTSPAQDTYTGFSARHARSNS